MAEEHAQFETDAGEIIDLFPRSELDKVVMGPKNKEVVLLRAIYRHAAAMFQAPYLDEHRDNLREAVAAYTDWKRETYS